MDDRNKNISAKKVLDKSGCILSFPCSSSCSSSRTLISSFVSNSLVTYFAVLNLGYFDFLLFCFSSACNIWMCLFWESWFLGSVNWLEVESALAPRYSSCVWKKCSAGKLGMISPCLNLHSHLSVSICVIRNIQWFYPVMKAKAVYVDLSQRWDTGKFRRKS